MELVLTKNFATPNAYEIGVYEKTGGYQTLKKLFGMTPDQVIEEVKVSGLRGRGGAGFSAGMKWGFIPKGNLPKTGKSAYLCINADESEPGTFKDRSILEKDPHRLVEGAIIAAYAIRAPVAYLYVRGEFDLPRRRIEQSIVEAYQKGYLGKNILGSGFSLDLYLHRGAGAYICGEETGLIESIEGKRGYPRIKPPFPAIQGLFGAPTIVNNVETLSALPYILEKGANAYRAMGTEKSTGTKLLSVSGPVQRPGVYEVEMGTPLRKFLQDQVGGMLPGKVLKALIPGGSSMPVLNAQEVEEVNIDYESMAAKGSMLGSGGVIVIAEDYCLVRALANLGYFYAHESCGQCSPCREGTGWAAKVLQRMEAGGGEAGDIDLLLDIGRKMAGATICVLADSLSMPIASFVKKFRPEFEEHIKEKKCPR